MDKSLMLLGIFSFCLLIMPSTCSELEMDALLHYELWLFDLRFQLFFADEKGRFDELVEDKGVKILIDPKALMHVIGTKMDFVDDKLR